MHQPEAAPQVRHIREDDAVAFVNLCKQLDAETRFMMFEPGERRTTADEQRAIIVAITGAANQAMFVAEATDELVGFAVAIGGAFRRNAHCASLVIGILQAFSGRGIGRQLLSVVEAWGRAAGIRRLELTVMTHNQRAISLYEGFGFELEGERRAALMIDGEDIDEFYMAKILRPHGTA